MAAIRKDAAERVSAYLESLPAWSKNICSRLRKIILNADASIVEDWKWGPNYNGSGMLCGYSAFQKHVKVTFYNGSAMKDEQGLFNHCLDNEFCRSIKYTQESEIAEELFTAYVKEAVAINQNGFKRKIKNKSVAVPADLQNALMNDTKAHNFFNGLSYGYKKEFVEQVITAKQETTRLRRIQKVVECCAEGRKLNDRYQR